MNEGKEEPEVKIERKLSTFINQGNRVPTTCSLIKEEDRSINTIIKMYSERIGPSSEHVDERLKEYAGYIKVAREAIDKNDWFYWMHLGIMTVANKTTVDQRSIAYLIGIYKAWLSNGFGTFYSAEIVKVKEMFKKLFNIEPSIGALKILDEMIQGYGLVFAVSALHQAPKENDEIDLSLIKAEQCEKYLMNNYTKIGGNISA